MSVIGQGAWTLPILVLIALHFALSPSKIADGKLMVLVAAAGITFDYLLQQTGVFIFPSQLFPLWLALLWLAFALTLNHSMSWLVKLPPTYQALLGAFGGSTSYLGGYFLGAVEFGLSVALTVPLLALVWGLAMPLYCSLQKVSNGHVALNC